MKLLSIDRHTFPPGGWQFIQPQTNWRAPTPTSSTFDQTVQLILKHRLGNRPIVAKHHLAIDVVSIGNELETFNRNRLGIPNDVPKIRPLPSSSRSVGVADVAEAKGRGVAFAIRRAAQGTAVVLDWLESGGAPVAQDLAESRAQCCIGCRFNVPGSWYTVAPAEIIRQTLSKRSELKLETQYDDRLLSCDICKCLNRLKVWCPMFHIVARTKPEVMQEFPSHCWIARRDQIISGQQ